MNRDKKILYIFTIILFIVLFFAMFLKGYNELIQAGLISIALLIAYFFIKKRSTYSINKRMVLLLVGIISILYLMVYYLTGLRFGFYKALYNITNLKILTIVIIPQIVTIVTFEILRSILLAQNNKIVNVLSFIIGIIVEIIMFNTITTITTLNSFMDLVGLTLLPAITSNIMYHYLCKRYGFYPNIVYRLVITIYAYIIPVVPATPDAIFAVIKLIIPLITYLFISVLYERKVILAKQRPSKLSYIITVIMMFVMISIVMIVSGQFKIRSIVIGSSSMSGELNIGDVVVYSAYQEQVIKIGDIIVFRQDENLIIHRVVDIKKINGVNRYYTKGDANEDVDSGYLVDSDIVGISKFKIAYLGYPTIWINDLFD